MQNNQNIFWLDYKGAPQTIAVIKKAVMDSQRKPVVRALAEEITQHLPSKDCVSEALAFYNLVLARTRYMRDPRSVEYVRAPWIVINEMMAGQTPGLDCFPTGTLLLDSNYRFVPIENIAVGQKIWGRDRWSEVQATAFKGDRKVDTIFLSNGSQITVTPDHKVYVRDCGKHRGLPCGKNCKHDGDLDSFIRIPVSELQPSMIMLSPERIPFGNVEQDPDRAWIEGGQNPIWRLGVRPTSRADGKSTKWLRVKSIERSVAEMPVWDIQTDDHYVYLPEADATVSNCDDMTTLICALAAVSGAECRAVTVAFQNMFFNGNRQYSHVFAQIKEPRTGRWITVDPVAGDKTEEMKKRVVAAKFWPIV